MGPNEVEKVLYGPNGDDPDYYLTNTEGQNRMWTVGRNGAKRELTTAEMVKKYLDRKANNGTYVEVMKVACARATPCPRPVRRRPAPQLRGADAPARAPVRARPLPGPC